MAFSEGEMRRLVDVDRNMTLHLRRELANDSILALLFYKFSEFMFLKFCLAYVTVGATNSDALPPWYRWNEEDRLIIEHFLNLNE